MAQLGYNADPTDVGEQRDFTPLTVGDKIMEAIAAEIKVEEDGRNKGKQQVVWEFRVVDGPEQGRKHWEYVTIRNPDGYTPPSSGNPATIGQQLNNSFAAAIGLMGEQATDTDNYLFKPVKVYLKAKKPYVNGKGETVTDGRQVGSIKPASGKAAAKPAASAGAGAAASSGGGKPKAYKNPDDNAWYDESGEKVPFFRLSGYEKVEA